MFWFADTPQESDRSNSPQYLPGFLVRVVRVGRVVKVMSSSADLKIIVRDYVGSPGKKNGCQGTRFSSDCQVDQLPSE
tara:strand:- start:26 stop:259 length:234 start_codon:yes stop_codon:yes gene_type:complete